jgi:hypothetical protein
MGLADREGDVQTAVSMLMSSMFGDAISREVLPNAFPQPVEDAPARYVRVFLRALGVETPARRSTIKQSAAGD